MSNVSDRMNQKRLRSSNVTVVVSIALVLFLLGLFGLIVLNSSDYAEHLKNQFEIEAYFKEAKDRRDIEKEPETQMALIDSIKKMEFVKSVRYIDKNQALVIARQQLGISEEDESLFEEGIFPPSMVMTVRPQYVDSARIDSITKVISNIEIIESVNDTSGLASIYERIDTIIYWLVGLAILFLVVSIILINNSLRLKIFSKRFTIKTMQLVGAKRRFIVTPFIIQSFWLGLLGSLFAIVALGVLWYYVAPKLFLGYWNDNFTWLIIGLLLTGIVIAVFSTFVATWRFLKLRTDQLYYS